MFLFTILPTVFGLVAILVTCVALPALLGSMKLVAFDALVFAQVDAALHVMALLATLPTIGIVLWLWCSGRGHAIG